MWLRSLLIHLGYSLIGKILEEEVPFIMLAGDLMVADLGRKLP
jgi:hypothetical protein